MTEEFFRSPEFLLNSPVFVWWQVCICIFTIEYLVLALVLYMFLWCDHVISLWFVVCFCCCRNGRNKGFVLWFCYVSLERTLEAQAALRRDCWRATPSPASAVALWRGRCATPGVSICFDGMGGPGCSVGLGEGHPKKMCPTHRAILQDAVEYHWHPGGLATEGCSACIVELGPWSTHIPNVGIQILATSHTRGNLEHDSSTDILWVQWFGSFVQAVGKPGNLRQ